MRVLWVDDDQASLNVYRDLLMEESAGFDVLTTTSGREAAFLLRKNRVDVVISDVKRPEWDGWWLLDHVRSFSDSVLFIMFTAMEVDPHKFRSAGGTAVFKKSEFYDLLDHLVLNCEIIENKHR